MKRSERARRLPKKPRKETLPHIISHLKSSPIVERAKMYQAIRDFFSKRKFLEVETPSLVPTPGSEIHIAAFETTFQPLDSPEDEKKIYLIPSPELAMKKLLCAGYKNIFQICKAFRNGESAERFSLHNPEFSMLEFYRIDADSKTLLKDFEALIPELAALFEKERLRESPNSLFEWDPPYPRISLSEAFKQYAAIELNADEDPLKLAKSAEKAGMQLDAKTFENDLPAELVWGDLFNRILVERVEPNLPQDRPFFLVDFPRAQASLAKLTLNGKWADRFELYLGPIELANGFTELTDAKEQRARIEKELAFRRVLNLPRPPIDEEFLTALDYGMPPAAGVAVGLDRLLMCLLGKKHIREVLPFPLSHE